MLAPMLIAATGILLSIIGIFLVRTREGASMRELLQSLGVGVNVSAVLIAIATFGILYLLGMSNWIGLSCSVITGLVAGQNILPHIHIGRHVKSQTARRQARQRLS